MDLQSFTDVYWIYLIFIDTILVWQMMKIFLFPWLQTRIKSIWKVIKWNSKFITIHTNVCFVDIGGIVDHYCLNFLFIINSIWLQLLVSCLVSCVYRLTRQYASRSYAFYTSDSTWHKQLYQYNMHLSH